MKNPCIQMLSLFVALFLAIGCSGVSHKEKPQERKIASVENKSSKKRIPASFLGLGNKTSAKVAKLNRNITILSELFDNMRQGLLNLISSLKEGNWNLISLCKNAGKIEANEKILSTEIDRIFGDIEEGSGDEAYGEISEVREKLKGLNLFQNEESVVAKTCSKKNPELEVEGEREELFNAVKTYETKVSAPLGLGDQGWSDTIEDLMKGLIEKFLK